MKLQDREQELDSALDSFERHWCTDPDYLERMVVESGLSELPQAIVEFVRADIDRRYTAAEEVDLDAYLERLPALLQDSQCVADIGFEDFRARWSRGLSVDPQRWQWMPGVQEAGWFQGLLSSEGRSSVNALTALTTRSSDPQSSLKSWIVERADEPFSYPEVGRVLVDFQLVALLGRGALSQVYLARQTSLGSRFVALKIVRRALQEPTHLARLQHTGIVPLFSVHCLKSYSILCMPYFGSATVADWLRGSDMSRGRDGASLVAAVRTAQDRLDDAAGGRSAASSALPGGGSPEVHEGEALRAWHSTGSQLLDRLRDYDARGIAIWLAERIASALAHAHARGIMHGDLKPANLLVRHDGEPALIDFNLARLSDECSEVWTGGTVPYMPPEQLQSLLGESQPLSPAADVFALGAVLYEIVESQPPFETPAALTKAHVARAMETRHAPRPLTNRRVSRGLQRIIEKSLQFSPHDRYPSASELLEDVICEREHRPLVHLRESWLRERLPKFSRRHPRLFSAGPISAVALVCVAALAWAGSSWREESRNLSARASAAALRSTMRERMTAFLGSASNDHTRLLDEVAGVLTNHFGAPLERVAGADILHRVSDSERALTEESIFDACLFSAAMAVDSGEPLTDDQRATASRLAGVCEQFPQLARRSVTLPRLLKALTPDRVEQPVAPLATASTRPLELVLEARRQLLQGQVEAAITELSLAQSVPEPAPLFWLTLGRVQAASRDYPQAALSFSIAIHGLPDAAVGHFERGKVHFATGSWQLADEDFSVALEYHPEHSEAREYRALARERLRDLAGAVADLDALLSDRVDSNQLLLMRSRAKRSLGQHSEADADFARAIASTPRGIKDWEARALARLKSDPQAALHDLREAEKLDPSRRETLQNLAHVQSEYLHDPAGAIQSLSRLLDLHPEFEMARIGRAVLYARQQDVEAALADVRLITAKISQPMPSTLYQIACVHALLAPQREASRDEAVAYLAQAIRRGYVTSQQALGTDLLNTDPDLDAIRSTKDFAILVRASQLAGATNSE